MFDGTIVSMRDTPENQAAYPQPYNQRSGLVFPITLIGAITSLACVAIIDLRYCQYAGKGQGEVTLLRKLSGVFSRGEVLLTDGLMSTRRCLYTLQQQGVDIVMRLNRSLRSPVFRKRERLRKDDHLIQWSKPHIREVSHATQWDMLRDLTIREARIYIKSPGIRTRVIVVDITLLDPVLYTKDDLAPLYRQRWSHELDLRSVKAHMGMECVRCTTPELDCKKTWTHVLAYNLIRAIMTQVASRKGQLPRTISFKGAMQTLEAFRPAISIIGAKAATGVILNRPLLDAIVAHRVADRPDRFEPRRIRGRNDRSRSESHRRPSARRGKSPGTIKHPFEGLQSTSCLHRIALTPSPLWRDMLHKCGIQVIVRISIKTSSALMPGERLGK